MPTYRYKFRSLDKCISDFPLSEIAGEFLSFRTERSDAEWDARPIGRQLLLPSQRAHRVGGCGATGWNNRRDGGGDQQQQYAAIH
jgi:hypothetical protein